MNHLAIVGYIFAGFGGVFLLALLKSLTEPKKFNFVAGSFVLCLGMAFSSSAMYLLAVGLWNYGLIALLALITLSLMNVMAVKITGMSFFPKASRV